MTLALCPGILSSPAEANEPPTSIDLVKPQNRSVVLEGSRVDFIVDVHDPDMAGGQVVFVTWTSNISGPLITLNTTKQLHWITTELEVGMHNITVTATDGEHSIEMWFKLTVIKDIPVTIRTYPLRPLEVSVLARLVLVVIVLLVSVAITIRGHLRRQDMMPREVTLGEEMAPPPTEAVPAHVAPPPAPSMEPKPVDREGLEALSIALGQVIDRLEHEKVEDRIKTTTAQPPPPPEPEPPLPPMEVLADRERTRQVRDVMMVLSQLPSGLPNELFGWEMGALARAVVDGEKRIGPDGQPYVSIGSGWYSANIRDLGSFLQPWHGPTARTAAPEDRASRTDLLDKLEVRLLEGHISEETYERLRRKYEGG